MVALNGVRGAFNVGSWLIRLCSVPSAAGISPGLARRALVIELRIWGAASHILSCWRIMLPMRSVKPFTGSTAIGAVGAVLVVAALGGGGATSRGTTVTS